MINVNARNLGIHTTGVQRYTRQIINHWDVLSFNKLAPVSPMHGFKGHLWEQFILPMKNSGGILWSPSNTGPLAVKNQVVTIHDIVPFDHPEWLNKKFVEWYQFLQPKLVKRVAHIITISEFSKDRIIDVLKVPESKISVVYNGVDSVDDDNIFTKQQLNLPFRKYLLSVGSLEPRKNISRLISAWKTIQSKLSEDIGLIIVGAKGLDRVFNMEPSVTSAGSDSDRVYFTGHVSDKVLSSLYHHADAFCYPSLYEGFGLPPLEAMSHNVPVITSNTTAMAELCGGLAELICPTDVDEIANAIYIQLTRPDLLRVHNAKNAVEKLSWLNCASQTIEIINGVS